MKSVFKTTWEIGTTWELKTATSVPRPIHYIEMDLRNKTTSEFRTVFDSPLGVPNSQVPLYMEELRPSFRDDSMHLFKNGLTWKKRLAV